MGSRSIRKGRSRKSRRRRKGRRRGVRRGGINQKKSKRERLFPIYRNKQGTGE
jgi:hypothetical protein